MKAKTITHQLIGFHSAGKGIEIPAVKTTGLTDRQQRELYDALADVVFQLGFEYAEDARRRRGYTGLQCTRPVQKSTRVSIS